jgi:DNA transposition AAA+ family ATPase
MAQALQMSSYKREYAKQLGVDVYSANAVLQKELGSVAWAAAAGNLTLGAATMASGSSVVAGLSYARNIDQVINIVASEPPAELMTRNRAALKKMGIDKDLTERFLAQRQYSPRAKTILIMALSSMTRTAGRKAVLEVSLQAPDETTAIFYQQLAELLNAYDARIAAIARLESRHRLVLARRSDGRVVILAALDNVIWNEQAASAAGALAQSLQLKPGGDDVELWITGAASKRFKSEAAALGIRVTEGASKQLTLLD